MKFLHFWFISQRSKISLNFLIKRGIFWYGPLFSISWGVPDGTKTWFLQLVCIKRCCFWPVEVSETHFWKFWSMSQGLKLGFPYTVIYVPGDRRSFEIRLRPISVRQSKWSNDSSQSAPSSAKRVRVLHRSLRRISGSQKWEGKMTPSDAFHRSNKVKELESSI